MQDPPEANTIILAEPVYGTRPKFELITPYLEPIAPSSLKLMGTELIEPDIHKRRQSQEEEISTKPTSATFE